MSPGFLILICAVLAINITPNETQKPIKRAGYEERANFKLHSLLAQKPIVKEGLENDNELIILHAVNQIANNKNDGYNNRFGERAGYRYTERDDSYEKRDDDTFKYKDDSIYLITDGQNVETVQNKGDDKLLAIILHDGLLNEHYSSEKLQSGLSSLECDRYNQDNIFDDLKYYLRSGLWKTCGKKAADTCRKACEDAIQFGCSGTACKSKMKKRMKKDCKPACKIRFDVEDEYSDNGNKKKDKKSSLIVYPYPYSYGLYGYYG